MYIDVMFYDILGFQVSAADIVGFLLSAVAASMAIFSFLLLYKASKILGGIIGGAFKKMMVGTVLNVLTVAFLGLAFGPLNQYEAMYVAIIGPAIWFTGNVFLFLGFRDIIKITKA